MKRELGTRSVRRIPPSRARELIEAGAKRALYDLSAVAPWDPRRPYKIRAEFNNTEAANKLRCRPGVERGRRSDDRIPSDTYWDAWRQ